MALLFMPNTFIQYIIVIEASQAVGVSPKTFPLVLWADSGYKMVMQPKSCCAATIPVSLGRVRPPDWNDEIRQSFKMEKVYQVRCKNDAPGDGHDHPPGAMQVNLYSCVIFTALL
jgi:hypothetical protein